MDKNEGAHEKGCISAGCRLSLGLCVPLPGQHVFIF